MSLSGRVSWTQRPRVLRRTHVKRNGGAWGGGTWQYQRPTPHILSHKQPSLLHVAQHSCLLCRLGRLGLEAAVGLPEGTRWTEAASGTELTAFSLLKDPRGGRLEPCALSVKATDGDWGAPNAATAHPPPCL